MTVLVRVTTEDCLQCVFDLFKQQYGDRGRIIVAEEEAESHHYHIMLTLLDEGELGKNNQNLRNFIKKHYGSGNAAYSTTQIRTGTERRVAAYCIKEGHYLAHLYTESELTKLKKISSKKYEGKKFQDEFNKIVEDFIMTHNQEIDDFIYNYVKLRRDYNQVMNLNQMMNVINLVYTKKYGPSYIKDVLKQKFDGQYYRNNFLD